MPESDAEQDRLKRTAPSRLQHAAAGVRQLKPVSRRSTNAAVSTKTLSRFSSLTSCSLSAFPCRRHAAPMPGQNMASRITRHERPRNVAFLRQFRPAPSRFAEQNQRVAEEHRRGEILPVRSTARRCARFSRLRRFGCLAEIEDIGTTGIFGGFGVEMPL